MAELSANALRVLNRCPPTPDVGPFDFRRTDRAKVREGIAVPCRLCERLFHQVRLTRRACACCEEGFCELEHGGVAIGGRGSCTACSGHA